MDYSPQITRSSGQDGINAMADEIPESVTERPAGPRLMGLTQHPQRLMLAGEIHARPFEMLEAPVIASVLFSPWPRRPPGRFRCNCSRRGAA